MIVCVVPGSDQALQQVVILKQELAELRAAQARQESLQQALGDSSVLAQQVRHARGLQPQVRVEGDMERSAHRETLEALEDSEQTVATRYTSVTFNDRKPSCHILLVFYCHLFGKSLHSMGLALIWHVVYFL